MRESISNTGLRIIVVFLSILLICAIFVRVNKLTTPQVECKSQIDSLIRINDSLKYEVFIEHTNYERYEIALDLLKEEDSIAAVKFEKQLFNIE